MDIRLTQDEIVLQRSVREFLEGQCPTTLVRELQKPESSGHSPELWKQLADLGWLGLAFPEEYGGGGASLFELGLVYEEAGRVLLPTTFYSTVFAGLLIQELGAEEQRQAYLPRIVSGGMIGTVALSEPAALYDTRFFETHATDQGNGAWLLSGAKAFVPNAHLADPIIVIARTSNGPADKGLTAFLVSPTAAGVTITPQATFDKSKQSVVRFQDVALDANGVLGCEVGVGTAGAALTSVLQKVTALQCMEMVGGAQAVLDRTVDYVKTRVQFGRPIGSFQAVQHHIANMSTQLDGARLSSYQAVWRLANGLPAEREVAIAKAWTGEAYKSITVMAHQLHGGMGYVRETDLHLWSQRAKATELSLGTRDDHLKALATQIGL